MLRQFFLTLPTELDDTARTDGARRLGVIRYVMVPLGSRNVILLDASLRSPRVAFAVRLEG